MKRDLTPQEMRATEPRERKGKSRKSRGTIEVQWRYVTPEPEYRKKLRMNTAWGDWRHYGWYRELSIAREVAENHKRKFNAPRLNGMRGHQIECRINPDTMPSALTP